MAADRPQRDQPATSQGSVPVTSRAGTGLLEHLTANALDEDYAVASVRRAAAGSSGRGRPGTAALLALALFGVLVATAGVQTARNAQESARSRESLVHQVNAEKADLAQRQGDLADLRREVSQLQSQQLAATSEGRALRHELDRLGVVTGAAATRGPGIEVVVDDAPHPRSDKELVQAGDLQKLVNALWQAGAEAISINGQRLTALSPIRDAAGAITVNFRSLAAPYTVSAIGDPRQMGARLLDTPGGQSWLTLESTFGMKFDVESKDTMVLPAARRASLRYAHEPKPAQHPGRDAVGAGGQQ
jgi:uncharacterized protein YlxW (UPF0749 family)